MKKLFSFAFIFSIATLSVFGQKKLHKVYQPEEWAAKPIIHDLPPQYLNEPALMLTYDVKKDYHREGRKIEVFYTMHRVVKVVDDKGIEMFNKVSIPVSSRTRVPLIKARTILPNGKVIDVPKDMIKVTRNEYGQNEIVFAMEGVEKNAEVELLLKEIKPYSLFGSEAFQFPVPVLNSHFELDYPNYLVFEEKGYNGYPDVKDTLLNTRRHISVRVTDIPALHSEPYSFYDLHRMRAEYRIHEFKDENDIDSAPVFTWDNLARSIYNDHYLITKEERAAVNKYLITLNGRPTNSDEQNVHNIEDGIKNNIVLYPDMDGENADNLDSIITNKAATPTGYIKLFAACFTQAEVKHELGVAGNRTEHHFDSKFENWGNLETYLFYFPRLGKFMSPTSMYTRYPIVPDDVIGNKGVFCSIPPKRDLTGPMADVRAITPLPASKTQHNMDAGISFNADMNAQVDVSYSFTGYAATDLRKDLLTEPKDKEKDLVKNVVTVADTKQDIVKYSITNAAVNSSYTNAPLEITATVTTDQLTEKAGKKYLLKVGSIMGSVDNLYDDKDRVMPIDLSYPESSNRTITVNIPKGYKILNPEALKMHSDYVNRDLKAVVSFHSDYEFKADKKNGDKLIVKVSENYPQMHFPVSDYQRYRAVVNTAADFNKVTLVLAKK